MKNFIIPISFLLPIFSVVAQSDYEYQYENLYLPRDGNGDVVYSEIIEAPGLSGDDLYTNAHIWFLDNFKSSKDVIQYEDRESGIIAGNGIIMLQDMALGYLIETPISFSLRIETKNERFRYQLSNLVIERTDPRISNQTIEQAFSRGNMYKKNGKPRKRVFNFYWLYDDLIIDFEQRIKSEIPNPPSTFQKNW